MEEDKTKKSPIILDWDQLLPRRNDDPPLVLVVATTTTTETKQSPPPPMGDDDEEEQKKRDEISQKSDKDLEEWITRQRRGVDTVGPRLPDKGFKLRKLLKFLEDEKERRKLRRLEKTQENGGEWPEFAEFYKETHFNEKTQEWVTPECQTNYNIIQVQEEHLSQPNVNPLTQEELSVKVLKPGSGYVKGLGLRPSSNVRTTTASMETSSGYVKHLEMEIEKQKDQMQEHSNQILELQQAKKQQEERTTMMMNWMMQQGFPGFPDTGGSSSAFEHLT